MLKGLNPSFLAKATATFIMMFEYRNLSGAFSAI
jgi:hypothetical protein